MIKLGIFTTHPIQYHVPLWRDLAKRKDMDVTVHYFSDHSIRGGMDEGFNRPVTWDLDLLKGYRSVFITRDGDVNKPLSLKIPDPKGLLEKGDFDCVLIQGYTNAFEVQVLREASRRGIQIVMRGEFSDIWQSHQAKAKTWMRKNFLQWFYQKVDVFGVIGENARQHLVRHGVSEDRMVFSPYAVDDQLFEAQKRKFKRSAVRRELGLNEKDFVLLFSGKLIPRKEPLLLLEAMGKLREYPNLKLIIVGDGPMKDQVEKAATRQIPKKLVFQGFVNQSQLGRYYRAADLFVHPSNNETWGLVINEAMQFGLPVITTDRVGCRLDLLKPGFTGFIFPSGNAEILAFQIKNMLVDRGLTRKMGQNAEKLVGFYSIQQAADGIHQAVKLALS
jgi:glycosyltransferase involved in cell wall biosynthesis